MLKGLIMGRERGAWHVGLDLASEDERLMWVIYPGY